LSSSRAVRRGGTLAAAAALLLVVAACRPIPETGLYSSQQYTDTQLTTHLDLQYGSAVDVGGQTVALRLDLYLPPADAPRPLPLVILVHGGGFANGNKSQMATAARSYARRGFAAASIGYRLDPQAGSSQTRWLTAALNAIDDGMESVRWLRANAATYGIDDTRIAMLGSSAGGGIAQGVAVHDDPTPGGPLASVSPEIHAAVSTGAHVGIGLDLGLIQIQPTDAPIMLFHYDTDTTTGATWEEAAATCTTIEAAGAVCKPVRNEGTGHTISLSAGTAVWTDPMGPFVWNHLRLHPDQGGLGGT
jgi:poly(3-hydroxybutyrate) depolymerase